MTNKNNATVFFNYDESYKPKSSTTFFCAHSLDKINTLLSTNIVSKNNFLRNLFLFSKYSLTGFTEECCFMNIFGKYFAKVDNYKKYHLSSYSFLNLL